MIKCSRNIGSSGGVLLVVFALLAAVGARRAMRSTTEMVEEELARAKPEPSYAEWLTTTPGSSMLAKELGGDEVLGVLANPDRGSAVRIDETDETRSRKIAGPIPIPPALLGRIAAVLGSERTYRMTWSAAKDGTYKMKPARGCLPQYGVMLRLEKGANAVDVYLCYGCHHMFTVLDGRRLRDVETDGGKAELLAIAQDLFPDDVVLRSLKLEAPRPVVRPCILDEFEAPSLLCS